MSTAMHNLLLSHYKGRADRATKTVATIGSLLDEAGQSPDSEAPSREEILNLCIKFLADETEETKGLLDRMKNLRD